MPSAYRSTVIAAPADEVWSVVRRFDGPAAWHPVIDSSSLDSGVESQVGAVRRLTTGDSFVEWYTEFDSDSADDAEMSALFGDGVFGAGLDALRKHVGT